MATQDPTNLPQGFTAPVGAVIDQGQGPVTVTSSNQNGGSLRYASGTGNLDGSVNAPGSNYGNPTGNGNYGPTVANPYGFSTVNGVVTPNSAPGGAPPPTATGVTGTTYNNDVSAAAQTPEQIQSGIAALYAQEIAGIQAQYNSLINQQTNTNANNTGSVRASAAASGALGSAAGNSDISAETDIGNKAIGNLSDEEQAALGAVTDKEATAALGIYNTNQSNLQTESTTYASQLSADAANALKSLPTLAASGADFSTIDATTLANLSQATGMSTSQLQSLYNAYQVAATKPGDQVIQSGDGTYWMVQTDPITGAVIGSQNLGLPASPISVPSGSAIFDPTTGKIVAQGTEQPTVVPITSSTVLPSNATGSGAPAAPGTTPPAGSGAAGSAPVAPSSPQGASSGAGAGTAPSSAPTAASTQTTGFSKGLASDGTATWASIASLPGVTAADLKLAQQDYATPQLMYNQGLNWILNGGNVSSSGGSSSGRSAATSAITNATAAAIGTGILQAYGLTEQDANTIAEVDSGLSSSLTGMIERQATVSQYIQKSQTQAQILNAAIKQYGENGASPLVNSVVQAFQKNIYSDPSFNSMQVALGTFLKDYARISDNATGSGAATTDASNAAAAEKLSTLMSQGSLQSALGTMWDEMNAQVTSLNTSVTGLQGQLSNIIQTYAASKNQVNFSSGLGQSGSTTAMASPQTPSGTVSMVGPDGITYNVPQNQVQAFIAAGGKQQ